MSIRIAAMADLHGYLPEIPDCDLLLLAGDICPDGGLLNQERWLDTKFRRWLEKSPAPVIATWGNHDFIGQRSQLVPELPWILLVDQKTMFNGLRIYGTPWTPRFMRWAFMADEDYLPWDKIPEGIDILISHGPPRGYGDYVAWDGANVGSPRLLERIEQVKPRLTVFGHIHGGRGYYEHNGIPLVNVSVVNEDYKLVHDAWVTELDVK